MRAGQAVLIDIREPDEFARAHAPDARLRPASTIAPGTALAQPGAQLIFTCRSGTRTAAGADALAKAAGGPAFMLQGGLNGWAKAGLPVVRDRKAPLELMRQMQIAAGLLVLIGLTLGLVVAPGLLVITALVGIGLVFAGMSGFCGMARLLAIMSWNRC